MVFSSAYELEPAYPVRNFCRPSFKCQPGQVSAGANVLCFILVSDFLELLTDLYGSINDQLKKT